MNKKTEAKRIKEIVAVFIKHGLKDGIKSYSNPRQVRLALEELGPTFIKIGQILSTRPDILPESFILEFQSLQDNVGPEPFVKIKAVIDIELGDTIENKFLTFNENPIACASLSEVHLATLKNGERVVVKIQRPNAKQTMLSDIALLKRLTHILKFTPQANIMDPAAIVDELLISVNKELDFLNEAENIKKFHEFNKDIPCITSPNVFDEYTTSNILVMEYIEGIKIANIEQLEASGYDLKDLATKLSNNYLKQVFEDGFFHADPHPGNIIVKENKIAYIDFGMIGTLSKGLRENLNMLLYGIAKRDVDLMTKQILKIGVKKGVIDTRVLFSDIEEIYNKYIEASLFDINLTLLLEELFSTCRKNNLAIPRDVTLLFKGMLTIEGLVAKIDPELNIMDIAIPYAKNYILKKKDIQQDVLEQIENLYALSKSGLKIPVKFLELINSILSGKVKLHMELTNLEKSMSSLNKMMNRLVFGIIVSALIIGSSLVIRTDPGPKFFNISAVGFVGYSIAVIFGVWLLVSILKSGKI